MKYNTLAELKAAYDSGEISKKDKLSIDNDYTSLSIADPEDEDDYITVFKGRLPKDLLKEALDLLGIPNEFL
jgi:hypothetical protein